jgi:RimJ/RimL family protein N-acetyltransferase
MLATDLAFGGLGLNELRATSVSTNVAVHSLHRKCGFKQIGVACAAQIIDGKPVDLVQYLLTPEAWVKTRERLLPLAQYAGTHIAHWEKAHREAQNRK